MNELKLPNSAAEKDLKQWSPNHYRVLYCVSRYAQQTTSRNRRGSWLRRLALLTLIYEGIENNSLSFVCAPHLVWLSIDHQTERRWLRLSQDAQTVIDDLVEGRLMNGLKMSSIDCQPVTAYQVSTQGMNVLEHIPQHIKDETDLFIRSDPSLIPASSSEQGGRPLLHVKYEKEAFQLYSCGHQIKTSRITEIDDISYVSSPYVPACVRSNFLPQVQSTCNSLRAGESARGQSFFITPVRQDLTLSKVNALIGEWIPFGANQIAALNERLGSRDRCQGGLFSSKIDEHPTQTQLEVPPGLTHVKILDYDSTNFINFEAVINYPEQEGVIQIEHFGVHLHITGELLYGVKVEAIMDKCDRTIPLDYLARLLVDVHLDSSEIIRDLMTRYQLSVLDMLFMGKPCQRNKYNMVLAEGIQPKLQASKYLDNGVRENQIKAIIGEIIAFYDITDKDMVFLGKDGCLFIGPSAHQHENLLIALVGLNSRNIFIRNFLVRTHVLDDTLSNLRKLLWEFQSNPENYEVVKKELSDATRHTILLMESLQYLLDSVENLDLPPIPTNVSGEKLYKCLNLLERKDNIRMRCQDSIKQIEKLQMQVDYLVIKFDNITRFQLVDVAHEFNLNIDRMLASGKAHKRLRRSVATLKAFFAGNLAFDIIDRVSGGTFHISNPEWFEKLIKEPFIDPPGLFFFINLAFVACMWAAVQLLIKHRSKTHEATIIVHAQVYKRIHLRPLHFLVQDRPYMKSSTDYDTSHTCLKTYQWTEREFPHPGATTDVELILEERHSLLRSIRLQVNSSLEEAKPLQTRERRLSFQNSWRRTTRINPMQPLTENSVLQDFTNLLRKEGVYPEPQAPLARLGSTKHLIPKQTRNSDAHFARHHRRSTSSVIGRRKSSGGYVTTRPVP